MTDTKLTKQDLNLRCAFAKLDYNDYIKSGDYEQAAKAVEQYQRLLTEAARRLKKCKRIIKNLDDQVEYWEKKRKEEEAAPAQQGK